MNNKAPNPQTIEPGIETIEDTIEFAKELAFDPAFINRPPNESEVMSALQIMDAQLLGSGDDVRGRFCLDTAYPVPLYELEAELISDEQLAANALSKVVVDARLHKFQWFGSTFETGFGLALRGVDVVEPERNHVPAAFAPLRAVRLRVESPRVKAKQ